MTGTLVRIDARVTLDYLRRPGRAAAIIAWLLVGSPLATAGVLVLLPLPGPWTTALVLMAAAPPILSAAPIAMILGLDGALAGPGCGQARVGAIGIDERLPQGFAMSRAGGDQGQCDETPFQEALAHRPSPLSR